jgi:protein involved in polysaccharide export with SLBB domain/glycosyltransferase involved in cell wall biosynthesis
MNVDCVVIGINTEGTLRACLESITASRYDTGSVTVYYVDGGSRDGSVEIARSVPDVRVIELRDPYPSPGKGRNAGWQAGTGDVVQFLDSDTVLAPDWLSAAVGMLEQDPDVAAVRGRLTERHPEASVYNWIGGLEWNPAEGECEAFGGMAMVRRRVLESTGGYDPDMVGGEEPELSQRIRLAGGRILHRDIPMATHDLGMTRFSQYWRRGYRTGYGYAAVTHRHGLGGHGFWARESLRILVRGGGSLLLLVAGAALALFSPLCLLLWFPALLLLFHPRLFRVGALSRELGLDRHRAAAYAVHCSVVVVPQVLGLLRYVIGVATGRPLRNRVARTRTRVTAAARVLPVALLVLGAGCRAPYPPPVFSPTLEASFTTEDTREELRFANSDEARAFSAEVPVEYELGPGDVLEFQVWNRPELSAPSVTVAPDGTISLLRVGVVDVAGRTVADVMQEVKEKLRVFYTDPEVNIRVVEYNNNRVFVLGRVAYPGEVKFPGQGTLMQALALAGGLPILATEAFLTRCAVVRDNRDPLWIDLRKLLDEGDMSLNLRLRNNDVVYIPESENELTYVVGEVRQPGPIRLKSRITYLDALMQAGGPTLRANLKTTFVIRSEGRRAVLKIVNLERMLQTGDRTSDFVLRDNDIVYIPKTRLAGWNDVIEQLSPSLEFLNLTTDTLEDFGVMAEIREALWGQEGFVGD